MDDMQDFPEESKQHIEALLSRHPPQLIMRMFAQAMESRRSSVASSYSSSTSSSFRSRLSIASSTFSTSTGNSDFAPSVASSSSSRSRYSRRPEPRSYPSGLDPTRPKPTLLTSASAASSPLETALDPPVFTPTEEDAGSIASPLTFHSEKSQSHSQVGDSFMFCTYCAELNTLKTFKAKSDWKKHEMRMHETGEDWPCPVNGCNRVHDRQKDFIKHHARYHSGRPLPAPNDIGLRLLPRRVFGCGFEKCKDVSIGWDERCDHVAKHMKNGATFEQWKYSNVIRNLIRQEALHDTWKDLFASLDEGLKESRSQVTWAPDNTRVLRQKLQCCDLRPSREEVLITALSLRSDVPLDPSQIQIPPGFITPSRDSVPNVDQLSREQRAHILNGNTNPSASRSQLAMVNAALVQANAKLPDFGTYTESPILDDAGRRISYMELDSGDFLPLPDHAISSMPPPPPPNTLPPTIESQSVMDQDHIQSPSFVDPTKPAQSNALNWSYPHYFDTAPAFEESQYYDRPQQPSPSFSQMISKPLHSIGRRLSSRHASPHSRPSSQSEQNSVGPGSDLPIQMPIQHPPQPHGLPHNPHQQSTHVSMRPPAYRATNQQDPSHLHLFTSQS